MRTRMRTGMIRHHAFRQFQGKLLDVFAQAVAQGAERLLFLVRQTGGFLFRVFVACRLHFGDELAAFVGQEDALDTTVVLIHGTGEQALVPGTGEDLTQGGRAKVQGFTKLPGGDARIRRGALQQAADGGRERRGFPLRRAAPHGAGELQICQDHI